MKRYLVLTVDFDSRPLVLKMKIRDEWNSQVKEQWEANQERVRTEFLNEFGSTGADTKLQNIADLDSKPWSILAFHNKFLDQVRRAFIVGSYYPALVSACALGERILNHLIRTLRDDFKSTEEYKKVYKKDSFDDWGRAIGVLESWDVLLPDAAQAFRRLESLRHRSIHFDPAVDANDRALALEAIQQLSDVVRVQFGAVGRHPWFIPGIPGASYLTKEAESLPFISKVYIPSCVLVGPKYTIEFVGAQMRVRDDNDYEEREISDDEFRRLLGESRQ